MEACLRTKSGAITLSPICAVFRAQFWLAICASPASFGDDVEQWYDVIEDAIRAQLNPLTGHWSSGHNGLLLLVHSGQDECAKLW